MKNTSDGVNDRLVIGEEKIFKYEDIEIETKIKHKKKKELKKMEGAMGQPQED